MKRTLLLFALLSPNLGAYPVIAARTLYQNTYLMNWCTGAVLSPYAVLTNADCLYDSDLKRMSVPSEIQLFASPSQMSSNGGIPVSRVIVHPGYYANQFGNNVNLAMLISAKPIPPPYASLYAGPALPPNSTVTLVGTDPLSVNSDFATNLFMTAQYKTVSSSAVQTVGLLFNVPLFYDASQITLPNTLDSLVPLSGTQISFYDEGSPFFVQVNGVNQLYGVLQNSNTNPTSLNFSSPRIQAWIDANVSLSTNAPSLSRFVKVAYEDLLWRVPSQNEVQAVVNALNGGLPLSQFVAMLLGSDEFHQKMLMDFYVQFERHPVSQYYYSNGWNQLLTPGYSLPDHPSYSIRGVLDTIPIFESSAFNSALEINGPSGAFFEYWASRLYGELLGRSVSWTSPEVQVWSSVLAQTSDTLPVMKQFLYSQEFFWYLVASLYRNILRREPQASDTPAMQAFTNAMNNPNAGMTLEQVIQVFMTGAGTQSEYFNTQLH